MKKPELKPCPFCGYEGQLEKKYVEYSGGTVYSIGCKNLDCKCEGPYVYDRDSDDNEDTCIFHAIEKWNKRVMPTDFTYKWSVKMQHFECRYRHYNKDMVGVNGTHGDYDCEYGGVRSVCSPSSCPIRD